MKVFWYLVSFVMATLAVAAIGGTNGGWLDRIITASFAVMWIMWLVEANRNLTKKNND